MVYKSAVPANYSFKKLFFINNRTFKREKPSVEALSGKKIQKLKLSGNTCVYLTRSGLCGTEDWIQ